MSNLLTAEVTITGTRPLLWHHFGPDAIPLERQERTGVPGNDPEEWKRTVLMTPDRQLYVEGAYMFSCLRDGAKFVKVGRGSLQPILSATLQISEEILLIDRFVPQEPLPTDPGLAVYLDIRSVVNPSTKGRNIRYRVAASKGWSTTFHCTWDGSLVARGQMERILIEAGSLAGIGSNRSRGCGRFAPTKVEITST